ncbi:serine/threonine-protein kinase [Micromonospora thermarum]|uniref:non-specific serine/threonine protein kinase n=1 Tax=Micromonospora thermarum TaxID=2720024 RepID=A0ABX0ZC31_9ACTN|nr:serine/threonine-protein kinase [Micromonospora thermarum]NJP33510.1 protein kinase [Micromonospora thermarum]
MLTRGVVLSDRYRLDERVATGGMGAVWRCTDVALERVVAVKVLLPALTEDPEFTSRFRSEARMLAALRHPGVVAVHDVGRATLADGAAVDYLVMEYVDGEPLGTWLRRAGRLDPASTMSVVAQAADALHAAHVAGIVHRDVKPGNLLVKRDGRVVLVDFGIARSGTTAGLTAANMVLGTASYMSPEQAANQPVSAATDIYALGAVAYACLAGQPPFDGDNPLQVALRHLQDEPAPLPPETPAAVVAVVERAMAKRPADRWPDAAALADAASAARETTLAVVPDSARPPWAVAGASPAAGPPGLATAAPIPPATAAPDPVAVPPSVPGHSGPAPAPAATGAVAPAGPAPGHTGPVPSHTGPAPSHTTARPAAYAAGGVTGPAGSGPAAPPWQPSAYQTDPALSPTLEEPSGRRPGRRTALVGAAAAVAVVTVGAVAAAALLTDGSTAAPETGGGTPVAAASAAGTSPESPTPSVAAPTGTRRPAASATPPAGRTSAPASGAPAPAPSDAGSATATSPRPGPTATTAAPPKPNQYTPVEVCGSGYQVIDSATLTAGGTRQGRVYLLYHTGTGTNCVVTLKDSAVGTATATSAWLEVQGRARSTDSGSFAYYAGPVRAEAAGVCVKWGGSTGGASYGSGFEHCG